MDAASSTIEIKVLFFASARQATGTSQTTLTLSSTDANTSQLRHVLASRYPQLAESVLDEASVTLALNEEYVAPDQVLPLQTGDTVALIPPISGG